MTSWPAGSIWSACTGLAEWDACGRRWRGEVKVAGCSIHMAELLIYGRGSRINAVFGKYMSGHYICIPDIDVGWPLGRLSDTFWNKEEMTMIHFTCKEKESVPSQWKGTLRILRAGNPCEAEISARGSWFHLIVGKHAYGNYVCIPNWNVGTELSRLSDTFWNRERLREYSQMKEVDICTVVTALAVLDERHCTEILGESSQGISFPGGGAG